MQQFRFSAVLLSVFSFLRVLSLQTRLSSEDVEGVVACCEVNSLKHKQSLKFGKLLLLIVQKFAKQVESWNLFEDEKITHHFLGGIFAALNRDSVHRCRLFNC